ncbi:MAG: hypothetical protein EOO09_08155 [Chitinophagaceae bacterium]|nr:MAG: hypothetical protein EOO09_08155 [Chitinophagaceae bacterium]
MTRILAAACLLLLLSPDISIAQTATPKVVFQTGMGELAASSFRFSPGNTYLLGSSDLGDYAIWDLRSGRQIKRIAPAPSEIPDMIYLTSSDISPNERHLLIPEYPIGIFDLYDLFLDSTLIRFVPEGAAVGEMITNARFSADGSKILLVSQSPGEKTPCFFTIVNLKGEIIHKWEVLVPPMVETNTLLMKVLLGKNKKLIDKMAKVNRMVVSPNLNAVYFTSFMNKVYSLSLTPGAPASPKLVPLPPGEPEIEELGVYKERLVLKKFRKSENLQNDNSLLIDTFFVLNRSSFRLERTSVAKFTALNKDLRSNGITTAPRLSSGSMGAYLDTRKNPAGIEEVVCRDMLTGEEFYVYPFGKPFHWYTKGDYKAGELNGGIPVAISDDHTQLLENTRDLVVHDINNRTIRSYFSGIRGPMRLAQPVFLSATQLLIPKVYNDAFIVDIEKGNVNRLKREEDCQDTARNGANIYFEADNNAQVGIQVAVNYPDEKRLVLTNYLPNDLCTAGNNRTIDVYETGGLKKTNSYSYRDPEYAHHVGMLPGNAKKFTINFKLVDFSKGSDPLVTPLYVIQKKDTFFAFNPVYLPASKTLFAVCGNRMVSADADLVFAHFNTDGKVVRSFRLNRKKLTDDWNGLVTEGVVSPDGNKLLFTMVDGTAGLFDIVGMKMIRVFPYSKQMVMKKIGLLTSFCAYSAVFIDNETFVTSGLDFKLKVWSTSSPEPIRILDDNTNVVYFGLAVSPDKKVLIGTDKQKIVRFIDLATGKNMANFAAFNYSNYALVNNEGYYMANKQSNKELTFMYNGKAYEFSQFDLGYNRPDKVLESLGYASKETIGYFRAAHEKRIKKLGYKNTQGLVSAPAITLAGLPAEMALTSANDLAFTVTAADQQYTVSRLFVTVNGVPLYGAKGLPVKQAKPGPVSIPVKLPLGYGKNQVVVSATNSEGIESLREFITVNRKNAPVKPALYLVAIGSGTFSEKSKNLKYAAKDAGDFVNLFDSKSGDYSKITKVLLTNEKVTKKNVQQLKANLKQSKPDDVVVVFFAGHGILDKDLNYYLSTFPTDFTKPSVQGLAYDELEGLLDSIPSRNKVLLIDACHSGELDKETVQRSFAAKTSSGENVFRNAGPVNVKETAVGLDNSFQLMGTIFPDLRRSSGASVIAAAGSAEYAVEGDKWKNGVFTYSLQSGLKDKKADLNQDGIIQLSELLEFLQQSVSELTGGNQRPTSRTENIVNDIRIW